MKEDRERERERVSKNEKMSRCIWWIEGKKVQASVTLNFFLQLNLNSQWTFYAVKMELNNDKIGRKVTWHCEQTFAVDS